MHNSVFVSFPIALQDHLPQDRYLILSFSFLLERLHIQSRVQNNISWNRTVLVLPLYLC